MTLISPLTTVYLLLTPRLSYPDASIMSDNSDCTFESCSIEDSVFQYRPSLAGNATVIALFGVSLFVHAFQGYKYRQWTFSALMVLGCISEMVGYGARVMMYQNPWDFNSFLMQISQ